MGGRRRRCDVMQTMRERFDTTFTADSLTSVRELDHRVSEGIQVRLLWCEHDDSIWVSVFDLRNHEAFRVQVGAEERPRDVFLHPFAYAAGNRTVIHAIDELPGMTAQRV